MKRLALLLSLLALPVQAQEMADAPGASLRILDKLTGVVQDVTLARSQSVVMGRLTVQLDACRSPADNTVAEADAHLTILDAASTDPVFAGWMTASAPALSALDHPRYDVWLLRCDVPELALPEVEDAAEDEGEGEAAEPAATEDSEG
jgi:hypothetical protein